MRRVKLNMNTILILADSDFGLDNGDDSDAHDTWQPNNMTNIGGSDNSNSDDEEDSRETEHIPVVSTMHQNNAPVMSSPEQQMNQHPTQNVTVSSIEWSQRPFAGKPLPGNIYRPYLPINISHTTRLREIKYNEFK